MAAVLRARPSIPLSGRGLRSTFSENCRHRDSRNCQAPTLPACPKDLSLRASKNPSLGGVGGRRSAGGLNRRSLFGNTLLGISVFTLAECCVMSSPSSSFARVKSSEVDQILNNVEWPARFPFSDEDFQRYDESDDTYFYSQPRFVTHIDDPAINALTKFYSSAFPNSGAPGIQLLDMCSSWISHYPKGYKADKIVGMGLNEEELKRNPIFNEYYVQDLNSNTKLPFEDNTFDVVTNTVSVDYLTKPIQIFQEMNRVLKPGGLAIMSFSNRCFWTKAISIWTQTGDVDHVYIVGAYFHYAGGYEPPKAKDISPNPGRTDPMYVVYSRKLAA